MMTSSDSEVERERDTENDVLPVEHNLRAAPVEHKLRAAP